MQTFTYLEIEPKIDSEASKMDSSKHGHSESWQLHLESRPAKKLILPSVETLLILWGEKKSLV